ncbi:LysM peptidoglycan-binding domain-containing protein [Candidatus Woesearchaeota archaeon]|jgi:hypothetical protein|nr:LysM peptidoglycan-binding domain-containing protein [Candidatus Woesearchaeota archaeon]MBT3537945.1 LysM peptidoglycan-binding domain-containing protein [Candidatus Woesearchaeota archaeon]MBT4698083.1 LysM peptidoglycan-binding domain-containing protein [Candidatus Woesearchaeota archaeon]MBT4717191.1 LysM peptidoglycan-binding domain-containing protein [Candidatus Woesearchaeota archaeon]MBT7105614.1 LysM peptidoglycan-binding domain-containing protein [Candidatus Woesearchaeota archaeon
MRDNRRQTYFWRIPDRNYNVDDLRGFAKFGHNHPTISGLAMKYVAKPVGVAAGIGVAALLLVGALKLIQPMEYSADHCDYTVQRGDTPASIAQKAGYTGRDVDDAVSFMCRANENTHDRDVGQGLLSFPSDDPNCGTIVAGHAIMVPYDPKTAQFADGECQPLPTASENFATLVDIVTGR